MSLPSKKEAFAKSAKASWGNFTDMAEDAVRKPTGWISGAFKRRDKTSKADYTSTDYNQYNQSNGYGGSSGGYGGWTDPNQAQNQAPPQWSQYGVSTGGYSQGPYTSQGYHNQPYPSQQQPWGQPTGTNPDGSPFWPQQPNQPPFDQSQTSAPGGYAPTTTVDPKAPPQTQSVYSTPAPSANGPSVPPTNP